LSIDKDKEYTVEQIIELLLEKIELEFENRKYLKKDWKESKRLRIKVYRNNSDFLESNDDFNQHCVKNKYFELDLKDYVVIESKSLEQTGKYKSHYRFLKTKKVIGLDSLKNLLEFKDLARTAEDHQLA